MFRRAGVGVGSVRGGRVSDAAFASAGVAGRRRRRRARAARGRRPAGGRGGVAGTAGGGGTRRHAGPAVARHRAAASRRDRSRARAAGGSTAGGTAAAAAAAPAARAAPAAGPSCTAGGVCTSANPCHVGQTVCSASGVAVVHGHRGRRRRTAPSAARTWCATTARAPPARRGAPARPATRAERGRSSARRARPSAPKPLTSRTGRRAGPGWSARRGSAWPVRRAPPARRRIPVIRGCSPARRGRPSAPTGTRWSPRAPAAGRTRCAAPPVPAAIARLARAAP